MSSHLEHLVIWKEIKDSPIQNQQSKSPSRVSLRIKKKNCRFAFIRIMDLKKMKFESVLK